jgi:hypothetical protein
VTGPTGSGPGPDDPEAQDREDWLRGLDTALTAAGFTTRIRDTAGGLDLKATIHPPGQKPTDVIADEDGYLEIHWWSDPDATPQQVAAALTTALTALTGAPPAKPAGES